MVTVGRIVRPQHNRGEVAVAVDTDFPAERFAAGATVYREDAGRPVALTVRESRRHDGRWVVGFEGVDSIDAAESLRGLELRVPAEALVPLGPGTFYVHDLVGCRVATAAGERVGRVTRVDGGAGVPLLVVTGGDGDEVLVPFAAPVCRRVDVAAQEIVIDPPPGLIELNRPTRS